MKIPDSKKELTYWANNLIEACNASSAKRLSDAMLWKSFYLNGCEPGDTLALFNKTFAHIDALSSALYSPAEVRFYVELDAEYKDAFARAETISNKLTEQFRNDRIALVFANVVPWALVYGKAFVKLKWDGDCVKAYSVMPYEVGVYREDYDNLDDQEAICQTHYLTFDEIKRRLKNHPDETQLLRDIKNTTTELNDDSHFQRVVMSGIAPIITQGAPQPAGFAQPRPLMPIAELAPQVAKDIVKCHELWVWDDDRDDWTTIQVAGGHVIEGALQHRNIFVKGHLPFAEVCPNPIHGNFWGLTEIAQLRKLQDGLNQQLMDVMELVDRSVRRTRAFIGFEGLTDEKVAALQRPSSWIAEDKPGAKVEDLTPPFPPELWQSIHEIQSMFDEVAGFTPTLQGRGEQGVRSAQQAETLVRMSSPRLKDRALLIEHQVAELGDLTLKLMQAHMAEVNIADDGTQFYLSTLPDDYTVTVNAHSASPVFIEDALRHAQLLLKDGVIDAEDYLRLTNPPMLNTLIANLRKREAAKRKQLEELKKLNPEEYAKQLLHHGKR